MDAIAFRVELHLLHLEVVVVNYVVVRLLGEGMQACKSCQHKYETAQLTSWKLSSSAIQNRRLARRFPLIRPVCFRLLFLTSRPIYGSNRFTNNGQQPKAVLAKYRIAQHSMELNIKAWHCKALPAI